MQLRCFPKRQILTADPYKLLRACQTIFADLAAKIYIECMKLHFFSEDSMMLEQLDALLRKIYPEHPVYMHIHRVELYKSIIDVNPTHCTYRLYGESAIFYKTPTRAFVQRSWEQQLARSQIQRHATSKQLKTYGKGKCNCITDTWTYVGESCLWACGPC